MRFAVIDDEYPSRNELCYLITQYMPDAGIDEADSGRKAVELLSRGSYDAAFVDIHLGDMEGTSLSVLLKRLQPDLQVVFATAYDTYAVQAFEIDATDYIMKPFEPHRVEGCLQKIRNIRKEKSQPAGWQGMGKLTLFLDKKVMVLDIDDIAYIESRNHHCMVYAKSGEYLSTQPMNHFEQRLAAHHFFRIHKSYLANLQYVTELAPWINGAFSLKLRGFEKHSLPVSRNYVKALKEIFKP